MFAQRVDLCNRRPGVHQHAVRRDQIVEGNFVVDWLLYDRRSAAADQENHERRGGCASSAFSIADAARIDSSFGVGCPPQKYRNPCTCEFGCTELATIPESELPTCCARASTIVCPALPIEIVSTWE